MVKAPDALPTQIGLEGEFYPTYDYTRETGPFSAFGEDLNPFLSMLVYTGDLGMDDGRPQSVYVLDKQRADLARTPDGGMFRVHLAPGQSVDLPGGLGSVSFDRVERWTKLQISRTPGKEVALAGVLLALLGLMGSLFLRSRRVWVRARPEGGRTVVQVAGLDRSGGGDVGAEIAALARDLRADAAGATGPADLGRLT